MNGVISSIFPVSSLRSSPTHLQVDAPRQDCGAFRKEGFGAPAKDSGGAREDPDARKRILVLTGKRGSWCSFEDSGAFLCSQRRFWRFYHKKLGFKTKLVALLAISSVHLIHLIWILKTQLFADLGCSGN